MTQETRSSESIDQLAQLLKDHQFFKNHKELSYDDLQDVASYLKFEQCNGLENVITYGEIGTKFFIILEGVVRIEKPNPLIENYTFLRRDYN